MSTAAGEVAASTARYLRAIPNTDVPKEDIEAFCKRWSVTELSAYGTILDEEFDLNIRMGVMVQYEPDVVQSLLRSARMQNELEDMYGFRVNLTSPEAIEQDTNSLRRKIMLEALEKIYEA